MHQDPLTHKVIGCAMQVHTTLGPGFLESVYEHALAHEMRKAGLIFATQQPLDVRYDGILVGHFIADMIVQNRLIVEIKAVQGLIDIHEVQS